MKDNLVKRNWHGDIKYCFYDQETIQHFFISCPFTQLIWRIIYMTFNLPPPANIANLFGNWLNGVSKEDK
jgi:fructose-specific phosphotransferase system IIC component